MTALRTFASVSLALLLCAGVARAQTDTTQNNANPHDVTNKDRPATDATSDTSKTQVQAGETANPDSTLNKNRKQPADVNSARAEASEKENPHSVMNKDHDQMAGMDHEDMMANATPQMILQKLHTTNLKEIEAGKLAQQNGTSKVTDYARMLQSDHQDADAKVMALASKKSFTLSDTPMKPEMQKKMQMEKDRLSSLKGAEFDKTFTNMMARGHKHLIEMAQAWKSSCKDQDVCALIDTLMPKLQQHLATAEKLRGPMPQGRNP